MLFYAYSDGGLLEDEETGAQRCSVFIPCSFLCVRQLQFKLNFSGTAIHLKMFSIFWGTCAGSLEEPEGAGAVD